MTDLEYCDAFTKARTVRDDAIVPLLHRATTAKENEIHWDNVEATGDRLLGNSGCFGVVVQGESKNRQVFRISAEVTFGKDGQELCHSVKCVHVNAHPTAAPPHKDEEIFSSPEHSHPIVSFDLDQIRGWYGENLRASVERACFRLAERGNW